MKDKPNDRQQEPDLERAVVERLEFGRMERKDPEQAAIEQLSPRYVVQIKTERDPILEEIQQFRELAEEVDGRYDGYVQAACRNEADPEHSSR